MNPIVQWVLRTMMKGQTGVVKTLPKKELLDMNVNMTIERLLQNRIDPSIIKTPDQLDNIIKQIEAPRNVQTGIKSTKSAEVFDLEGKKIDPKKGIMGGKQIDDDLPPPGSRGGDDDIAAPIQSSEETIKNMIEAENKEGIARIREKNKNYKLNLFKNLDDKKKLNNDEYEEFLEEIGGEDRLEAYDFDGTAGSAKKILKDDVEYEESMFEQYKAGKLDPEQPKSNKPITSLDNQINEEFKKGMKEGKFNNVRLKDGRSIKSEDDFREYIDELNEDNNFDFAQGGRAGYMNGTLPMKKDGFFVSPDFSKMTPEEIELYKLQMEIMKKGFEKKPSPEGLEKLKIQQQIREQQRKDMGLPEEIQLMAQGGRAGFKIGGINKARRAFLKAAAGVGGGIAALKTGLLSIGKGADAVKNLPPIKTPVTKLTDSTTQMPDWFPSFINKFRDEGKAKDVFKTKKVEVSKEEFDQAFKEGKGENYYTDVARTPEYKANNPDHMDYYKRVDTDERIYTTYTNDKVPGVRVDDMDGNVDVMFENDYSQPVSMNYTAPGKRGPETGRADTFIGGDAKLESKPKGEFVANDVEVYATDPDGGSEAVDVIADTVDDMLEGKTRQMEEYVTGKKTKLSKGEERVGEAEFRAELAAEEAAEAADDFASGGLAGMLGE